MDTCGVMYIRVIVSSSLSVAYNVHHVLLAHKISENLGQLYLHVLNGRKKTVFCVTYTLTLEDKVPFQMSPLFT